MPFPTLSPKDHFDRRSAYAYPAISLGGSPDNLVESRFGSTTGLDRYLNTLLLSTSAESQVLGYLGVIFWGHYSGQTGRDTAARAMSKARMAYHGNSYVKQGRSIRRAGVVDIGSDAVAGCISQASRLIAQDKYSAAVSSLQDNLPQLKIAFASKVCAFLDPTKCGVIDSAIVERYPLMGFALGRDGYVKSTKPNIELYTEYCKYLQRTASMMNTPGPFSQWRDRDGSLHDWRAVDIERSLY